MANRYFQCAHCKKLVVLDEADCYITNYLIVSDPKDWVTDQGKLTNEICECKDAKFRMRELKLEQYNMEVALNRPINQ